MSTRHQQGFAFSNKHHLNIGKALCKENLTLNHLYIRSIIHQISPLDKRAFSGTLFFLNSNLFPRNKINRKEKVSATVFIMVIPRVEDFSSGFVVHYHSLKKMWFIAESCIALTRENLWTFKSLEMKQWLKLRGEYHEGTGKRLAG